MLEERVASSAALVIVSVERVEEISRKVLRKSLNVSTSSPN